MMKKVGILGGMGPEATLLLMERIMKNTHATGDQEHVPLLVDNNTQVPSRINAIIKKKGPDPLPVLCGMATSLEKSGAKALAMPCNTAHAFIDEIRSKITIPFISIVDETIEYLKKMRVQKKRIGILASPAVEIAKIFEYELEKNDMSFLYVGDNELCLSLIEAIKANDKTLSNSVEQLSSQIEGQKPDFLLIACSEFSIISGLIRDKFSIPVIDTLDLLVEKIIKFSTCD